MSTNPRKSNTLIPQFMANQKHKQEGITKKLDVERRKTQKIQQKLDHLFEQNFDSESNVLATQVFQQLFSEIFNQEAEQLMSVGPKSSQLIKINDQLENPVNFITSEQLQQEIFKREGSKYFTIMVQEEQKLGDLTLTMSQDMTLSLLDLFILGTDIQPLEELGDIEDVKELCEKLIQKSEVQKILVQNVFTQKQILKCIGKICQQIYSPMFDKMSLDEKIDAVFHRAQFLMDDCEIDEDSSDIHTDNDSMSSPYQPKISSPSRQYSDELQKEIQIYATDFDNFLELRQEEVMTEQRKEVEEDPADVIFTEIFGKSQSSFVKTQTFKKWQLQKNEEVDGIIQEIFEEMKDEVQLEVQQIYGYLRQSMGLPPDISVKKAPDSSGSFMVELNGSNSTYQSLLDSGSLSNLITTHFECTHGELQEMEDLLQKLQGFMGKTQQTETILLQFQHYFRTLNDVIYELRDKLESTQNLLQTHQAQHEHVLDLHGSESNQIRQYKKEIEEKDIKILELTNQIEAELAMQDVSNSREQNINEIYSTQLTLLKQENESLKISISDLKNELNNKSIFSNSKEHHQKVEIQELQKELTINLRNNQKLIKQLETSQKEFNWQIMLCEKANEKLKKLTEEYEEQSLENQMLCKINQNLEMKLQTLSSFPEHLRVEEYSEDSSENSNKNYDTELQDQLRAASSFVAEDNNRVIVNDDTNYSFTDSQIAAVKSNSSYDAGDEIPEIEIYDLEIYKEQIEKIEQKKQIYNILNDSSMPKQQQFSHQPSKLMQIYANANTILKDMVGQKSSDPKSKIKKARIFQSENIGSQVANFDLYMEKVHILEKGVLREIVIFVYRNQMYFMFLEKALSFMNPIDILSDIDEFIFCNMQFERDPKFQFLAIKLTEQSQGNNSHIFLVQHQFELNKQKLEDFINYQRYKNNLESMKSVKMTPGQYFKVKEDKLNIDFKFQKIRFDEKLLGEDKKQENKLAALQIIQVKPMQDLFLVKRKGFLISQWVNCQIELGFPNIKAQYILHNFQDLKETIRFYSIDTYLKDKYGSDYRSQKIDFLHDFLVTFIIKIGAQDIQNEKITAALILNDSFEIIEEKKDILEKVKQRSFTITCDQYAKIGVQKPTTFELAQEGVTQAHQVEYIFAQNIQNEAIFDKWLEKMQVVRDCHLLKEKKEQYWENIKLIKSTIWSVVNNQKPGGTQIMS